jgi:hypothetical protein
MARLFSRRKMIGAGGAVALAPMVSFGGPAHAAPLPAIIVLQQPVRVFDSRTASAPLGGGKLGAGESVAVSVGGVPEPDLIASAVYVNVTITDTEGRGHLVLRGSDLTGEAPLPSTSNVNWTADGQTVANLALVPVGGENSLEVHAGGTGRTHFIIDVQAYIPFVI